jgi:hypothetical protein
VRHLEQQATVILATPGNSFLERAIGLMPDLNPITIRVTDTLTNRVSLPSDLAANLTILDTLNPTDLPASGNLLFVGPQATNNLIRVGGTMTDTAILDIQSDHALLRYVEPSLLRELHISRARQVETPSWAIPLITARGGPLLFAGQVGGRRIAVLTFDLHHSDLPLKIAFPILMANLTHWLAPTIDG